MHTGDNKLLVIGVAVLVVLVLNFIPSAIAVARRHPEQRLLVQLNILSLLSFLLWFAQLVWAAGGKRDDGIIARFTSKANRRQLTVVVAALVAAGVGSTASALTRH